MRRTGNLAGASEKARVVRVTGLARRETPGSKRRLLPVRVARASDIFGGTRARRAELVLKAEAVVLANATIDIRSLSAARRWRIDQESHTTTSTDISIASICHRTVLVIQVVLQIGYW